MRYLKLFESFVKELVAPPKKDEALSIQIGRAPMMTKKYYFK